jgi:hypothetical protein
MLASASLPGSTVLLWLTPPMDDAASPRDPAAESAQILLALRHALADPLSAAALKLDLLERRTMAPAGADPAWVVERIRAAQADVGTANRLLDLLLRLAEIAGEQRKEWSLEEVCRAARVPLDEAGGEIPLLLLRRHASAEAIRSVAAFASSGGAQSPPPGRARLERGRVTLSLEGSRATSDGRPERLLELPHGVEEAEALFVARATVEADGGRLELTESGGRLVALFSWPRAEEKIAR